MRAVPTSGRCCHQAVRIATDAGAVVVEGNFSGRLLFQGAGAGDGPTASAVVADRPGVLAEITAAMRDAGVSIESLIQQGRPEEGGEVLVAMVTHDGPESGVAHALALLEGSASLTEPPLVMPLLG